MVNAKVVCFIVAELSEYNTKIILNVHFCTYHMYSLLQQRKKQTGIGGSENELFQAIDMYLMFYDLKKDDPELLCGLTILNKDLF